MRIQVLKSASIDIDEYRAYLRKYNVSVIVVSRRKGRAAKSPQSAIQVSERHWFASPSDMKVAQGQAGDAVHYCQLRVTLLAADGATKRLRFTGAASGIIIAPPDAEVTTQSSSGASHLLRRFRLDRGHVSARVQALARFARECLTFHERRHLNWFKVPHVRAVSFRRSVARFVATNSLLNNEFMGKYRLNHLLASSVNAGIHFRAPGSRREGNYWLPGLNGGIPFTPKKDMVHELTYLFHDLMHHLVPDVLFTGEEDFPASARSVYIAHRMMSEAFSLVLADMLFVDSIRSTGIEYDYSKRRILPLYDEMALRPSNIDELRQILWRVTQYCVLGNRNAIRIKGSAPAADAFEAKYTNFFIADFEWTVRNWENMSCRREIFARWCRLIGRTTLHRLDLDTLPDVMSKVSGSASDRESVVEAVFSYVFERRIVSATKKPAIIDQAKSQERAFRRYMAGQLFAVAAFEPLVGIPAWTVEVLPMIQGVHKMTTESFHSARIAFKKWVFILKREGFITAADARVFVGAFPVFDPYYLAEYERYSGLSSIAEASALALGTK